MEKTVTAGKQIGKVTHFYDKIGVAIVELIDSLSVGDTIKIVGHEGEFTQIVSSMQIEHQDVEKAEKGQVVGIKVGKKVREKDSVYAV